VAVRVGAAGAMVSVGVMVTTLETGEVPALLVAVTQ
jgi:hypothetical protein